MKDARDSSNREAGMLKQRTIGLWIVAALILMSVVPVAICDMPPGCPMWNNPQAHDCCATDALVDHDHWSKPFCRPSKVDAPALSLEHREILPVVTTITPAMVTLSLQPLGPFPSERTVPTAVPLFLLTHTLRL